MGKSDIIQLVTGSISDINFDRPKYQFIARVAITAIFIFRLSTLLFSVDGLEGVLKCHSDIRMFEYSIGRYCGTRLTIHDLPWLSGTLAIELFQFHHNFAWGLLYQHKLLYIINEYSLNWTSNSIDIKQWDMLIYPCLDLRYTLLDISHEIMGIPMISFSSKSSPSKYILYENVHNWACTLYSTIPISVAYTKLHLSNNG